MSVNVEITGKLIVKNETAQVSATFKKREFVVYVENERNIEYSDKIKIELKQDKVDLLDSVNVNDEIKVSCNITGREWTKDGKTMYFTTIEAWKLEKLSGTMQQSAPPTDTPPPPGRNDDLPF